MSKDSNREEFLSLLHQVVQHTPLKLEETNGTGYDRGYIFYQDMVLRDVEELETTMWEWHHQELQKARQNWLREEIHELEGWQMKVPELKRHWQSQLNYENAKAHNQAIQTIIDRYQAELDQDTEKLDK